MNHFPGRRAAILLGAHLLALGLAGCASLGLHEPPTVNLVGIEPIAGEGLESRFELRLRIQNPNERPIEYDGLWVELAIGGSKLASGVSDRRGTIPRFGEEVLTVPVSVSMSALVRQAIGLATGERPGTEYTMRGKLSGPVFGATRFESSGDLMLPQALRRRLEGSAR